MGFWQWLWSLFGLQPAASGAPASTPVAVTSGLPQLGAPPPAPAPGPGNTPVPGPATGGPDNSLADIARTAKTAAGAVAAVGGALGLGGGGSAAAAGGAAAAASGGGAAAGGSGATAVAAGSSGGSSIAAGGALATAAAGAVIAASVGAIAASLIAPALTSTKAAAWANMFRASNIYNPDIVKGQNPYDNSTVIAGGFRGTMSDDETITIVTDAAHPAGSGPVNGIDGPYSIATRNRNSVPAQPPGNTQSQIIALHAPGGPRSGPGPSRGIN